MRGTLLNTATVAVGATVGLLAGKLIPASYQQVALTGLGLVTVGMGVRMFLKTHNTLVPAVSIAVGGILGLALGIHAGIDGFASWAKSHLGGDLGRFNEGLITSFVLFCIGPMTLLGCMEDALEKKIELLALKSTMDGIAAVFLAAAFGAGVLVTAGLLFVFQGLLTLLAARLKPLADNPLMLDELTAAGGAILMGIGIGLIGLKDLHTANYLPALAIAPLVALGFSKVERRAAV
jgi:uncharacterized membrane protein YqgA involved in biofilm formation